VGARIATLQHVMATLSSKLATVVGARPLAWHLEGPFLNKKMPGAMNPEDFEIPTIANATALVDSGPVTLMAVAPEVEGAIPVIEYLVSRGVHVSIGHTDTDFEHAVAGIAAGATSMNHLFNVMRPLLHREPGPVGAAFLYDVYLQLIADGVHTHPATIALVSQHLKDRLVLISDSVLPAGLGVQGEFIFDGRKVTVDETSVRLSGGRLAGSILTLDRAVRNVVNIGGLDLASAFRAAGLNPARSIGVTDRGLIRPGAIADIVILTPDLHVSSTICEGGVVYNA
jgi:N-acetylglucosamine-6-phosphate deacetylase